MSRVHFCIMRRNFFYGWKMYKYTRILTSEESEQNKKRRNMPHHFGSTMRMQWTRSFMYEFYFYSHHKYKFDEI